MRKLVILSFFAFIVVALSTTTTKAQSAIAVSPGTVVVSYPGASGSGTIQIRVMENGVDLGYVASPFSISMQNPTFSAIIGLRSGRAYRFEVISNGVSLGWTNTVTPF